MPRLSKIGAAALAAFGWTSGASAVTATYLQVAGGGGAGSAFGGGGGAGGMLTGTVTLNPTLSYTVIVGAGGVSNVTTGTIGTNGSNSQFGTLTASVGGGYGGASTAGGAGGSGGGAGSYGGAPTFAAALGTAGQGNNGGQNTGSSAYGTGGGGGAGAVGGTGTTTVVGSGGIGLASSISGTSTYYAGGGGGAGGAPFITTPGAGGNGGGGAGGSSSTSWVGVSGTASTGGGGGAGAYNGTTWQVGGNGGSGVVIISYPSPQKFGGGIVTTSGSNVIHTFTTSGTLAPLSTLSASYLIVAGGGGGGNNNGGGGGGGGLLTGSSLTIDTNSIYVVTVGSGGAGNSTNGSTGGASGTNSVFSAYTTAAVGGGGGAGQLTGTGTPTGLSGGSGGGGTGGEQGTYTGGSVGGSGTSGQGNTGGTGANTNAQANRAGGGGGGAGAVGGNASTSSSTAVGGAGGAGSASSISGTSTYYSGGGGGGTQADAGSGSGGAGGTGGGGNGAIVVASVLTQASTAGTANTGGGGGGQGRSANSSGQNGGSGIVIISYAGATQLMAGGTVTISGGNVIHTFTSSGYLTPLKLVNNSLRTRNSVSAYLSRTPTVAGNRQTWTFSAWIKRGLIGTEGTLISGGGTTGRLAVFFDSSNRLISDVAGTGTYDQSTAVYRDPAAWYHFVWQFDTTQATAANRSRMYMNGVAVSLTNTRTFSQNTNYEINNSSLQTIGTLSNSLGGYCFDGEMTEVNFIDGQALTPNSFGSFNSYGVWQPITYGGSYGTNGFYLPFTNKTSTTTLGYDFSPNGNNWTTNNISLTAGSTYDSMTDVPTLTSATAANTCTWNPLASTSYNTLSNGNLTVYGNTSANNGNTASTFAMINGLWYVEMTVQSSAISVYPGFGITLTTNTRTLANGGAGTNQVGYAPSSVSYNNNGDKAVSGSTSAYGASYTNGDVIGIAVDATNGAVYYSKNGTFQGGGVPTSGASKTGAAYTWTGNTVNYSFATSQYNGSQASFNFGQQPFVYTPPSGYVALNTYNL